MTDAEAKIAVFKAVIKGYFLQNKEIQKLYHVPSEEEMKKNTSEKDGFEVIRRAREKAFELFWTSFQAAPKMNGDGTPRPLEGIADTANAFLTGKPICFLGIGQDNFVQIKAGAQRERMYDNFLQYNIGRGKLPDAYTGNSGAEITTNYKPELNAEYDNRSSEKPTGGSWWNKIVKAFTGHSSARWAAYDLYLKHESVKSAQAAAKKFKETRTMAVEVGTKKEQLSVDPLNKGTVDATITIASNEVSTVDFLTNQIHTDKPAEEYDKKIGESYKAAKQKLEDEPAKEEIDEDELDDDEIKPKKTKKELEQERLLAKKEAREKLQASADEIIYQLDNKQVKNKPQVRKDLLSSGFETNKLVTSFRTVTKFVSDPDSIQLSEEALADHLTNMYLAGKLLSLKGKDGSTKDNNENTYGVIYEDFNNKNHPVYNDIKAFFLEKDNGLSTAEKMRSNPAALEKMLSAEGLKEYVQKVDQKSGNLVDNVALKNYEKAVANWNVPEQNKEKTNSTLSV